MDALSFLKNEISESGSAVQSLHRLRELGVDDNQHLLDLCLRHLKRDEFRREMLGYIRPAQQVEFERLLDNVLTSVPSAAVKQGQSAETQSTRVEPPPPPSPNL